MTTKAQVRDRVKVLVGKDADLSNAQLNAILESENDELLEEWQWVGRETLLDFDTPADITAGTVTATDGSAALTFASVSLTSAVADRYIRIDGRDTYDRIATFTDATAVSIESAWEIANASAVTYRIFALYHQPATDCLEILEIKYQNTPLRKWSAAQIERVDANRNDTGDPVVWAPGPNDSSGRPRFELWPRPTSKAQVQVRYIKRGTITNDSDVVIYPAHLLQWKAASVACMFLAAQEDAPHWDKKAGGLFAIYDRALTTAKANDHLKQNLESQAADALFGSDEARTGAYYYDHELPV